jgi:hypothetical protein
MMFETIIWYFNINSCRPSRKKRELPVILNGLRLALADIGPRP